MNDYIKEKILNYREVLRGLILLFITFLSGSGLIVFKALSKQVDMYLSFIGIFLFSITIILAFAISIIWNKIEELTEELK